jgi:branched-chain amino acid transport system substrate-binding protein
MKKIYKLETTILLLFLLTTLAFITIQPSGRVNASTTPTVIKIGVVTDISALPYDYYGQQEVAGLCLGLAYELGVTNVTQAIQPTSYGYTVTGSGYQFQIYVADYGDDTGDTALAANAAVQLVAQDNVQMLQGSSDSDSAIAVAAVAAQYGVTFFAAPAADYDITAQNFNVYTFRLASSTYQDALAGAPYAVQHVGKTFALIAPYDSWGFEEVSEWTYVIQNAGGKVVTVQEPPYDASDYTSYIDNILSSNATVLVPIWIGTNALTLYKQLYTLGVYNKMTVSTGFPDETTFNFNLVGQMPVYVGMDKYSFNLPNNPVNTWLINNYVTLFKEDRLPEQSPYFFPLPDIFIPDSFATGQAIVAALTMTGGNPAAPGMIQALQGMYLNTPKGPMYIRPQDHQALQDMYVVKLAYYNSTITQYYTGPSQIPSTNYWVAGSGSSVNIFKTGYWGVQLIEPLNETQTPPPIYASTATATRPAVGFTTTCTSATPVVGKPITCKATVVKSGSKAATGTVTWSIANLPGGSGSGTISKTTCTLSGGACVVKFTPTSGGPTIIVASYGGGSGYQAASAGHSMLVSPTVSKTAASCSPKSVVAGSSKTVTCKATITGYVPTGTVTWSQSGTGTVTFSATTCTLTSVNSKQATCSITLTGKTAGSVSILATYGGDANNKVSSVTAKLTVKT